MKTAHEIIEEDLAYMTERLGDTLVPLEGKRLLITGGAGFLGYYLSQLILFHDRECARAKLIDLTVWDNYISGMPAWLDNVKNEPAIKLKNIHGVACPLLQWEL